MLVQYRRIQNQQFTLINAIVSLLKRARLIGFRNSFRAENGSAIISARTRQRMTPVVISLTGADRQSSCKHLCCREGVDKAPKPPKLSTASAALSEKPKMKKIKKEANISLENQPMLQADRNINFRKGVDIEKTGLSNTRDLHDHEYLKTVPWHYKKLHLLHESVNKGPPVPILSSKKITFCHERAEEPRILPCATNYPEVQTRRSSDYDSAGMDEFPSPSAILCMDKKCAVPLSTTVLKQNPDVPAFEDDLSDLELEILRETKVAEQDERARTGLADHGLRGPADVMDHDGRDKGSTYPEELPILPTAKPNFNETSPCKSDGPLFLSMSSPKKEVPSLEKRKSTYAQETEGFLPSNESMAKRQKVSKLPSEEVLQPSGQVLQLSAAGKDQGITSAQALGPIIQKSGRPRPEWVNEFDPGFIAEYADIVEFI